MSDVGSSNLAYCLKNNAQCTKCAKRACNEKSVQFEKKLSCVKCTPDKNNDCNVIEENTKATECTPTTLGYANGCYVYQKGNVSHRGCLYEATDKIFGECSKKSSKACSVCNKSDCNRQPITASEDLSVNLFHSDFVHDGSKTKLIPCENDSYTEMNSRERVCYKCDSRIDPNCTSEVGDYMVDLCSFDEEDLGCYHMITGI